MKRLLLTGVMAMLAITKIYAQNGYSQNFNGTQEAILAEGWLFPAMTGTPENTGIYSTSPSIAAIGIEGGAAGIATFNLVNNIPTHIQNLDCAIVSPVIELPATITDISYRVGSVRISGSANSHYSMYVLTETEYNTATTATALKNLLNGKMAEDEATIGSEIVDGSFETTDYTGQRIRLVFRIHNSPGNTIFLVDNIVIQGAALNREENETATFVLYPNPVSGQLTIAGNNTAPVNKVTLTDSNGRVVFEREYNSVDTISVDTQGLSRGFYIVNVLSGTKAVTHKIIKS